MKFALWMILPLILIGCGSPTPSPTEPDPTPSPQPATKIPPSTAAPKATPRPEVTFPVEFPEGCDDPSDHPFGLYTIWEEAIPSYLEADGDPNELESLLTSLCVTLFGNAIEPARAEVIQQDLNRDGSPDLLLGLTLPYGDGFGEAHLIAFFMVEGGYEPLIVFRGAGAGSRAEGLYSGGGLHIAGARDMDGDGNTEIVFSINWDDFAEFYILSLRNNDLVSLIEQENELTFSTDYRTTAQAGLAVIEDVDEDGKFEFVISESVRTTMPGGADAIERREIWSLEGKLFAPITAEYLPDPTYRIEAVRVADFAALRGDYEAALAMYQRAIFDESLLGWSLGYDPADSILLEPDPDERERLAAYGRYRLMLLHAVQGNVEAAATLFRSLQNGFPLGSAGDVYAELAQVFMEDYLISNAYWTACTAAVQFADELSLTVIDPLSDSYYLEYGLDYAPMDICPWGF